MAAALVMFLGLTGSIGQLAENTNVFVIAGALVIAVIIMSAIMDSYYLALEKIYRKRYEWVVERGYSLERYNFRISGRKDTFELNPRKIKEDGETIAEVDIKEYRGRLLKKMWVAFKSPSIWAFYVSSIIIVVIFVICLCYIL